jgi:hypothetical protein
MVKEIQAMRMLRQHSAKLILAASLVVGGLGLTSLAASGPVPTSQSTTGEHHPHIHAALRELREARRELKEGAHDFGGHRVEAVKAVDHAITQLERALKFDKN